MLGDRRLWWQVHQWAGLKLSIALAFICFTGTLAVLSHEIDWLLQPSLRVAPSTVEGAPRWDRIVTAAAAHPSTRSIVAISEPTASAFAARVTIIRADGSTGFLHAHPATGVVQGEGPWAGAPRILRNMHRHLNLPTAIGVPIVSALALPMLASVITAFVVYKGWWRGFLKPVRAAKARTLWGDAHRLAGVWSLWFLLLIGLTSLWYLVESLGLEAPPLPATPAVVTSAASASNQDSSNARRTSALPRDDAHAVAARFAASRSTVQRDDPDLRIEHVVFPTARSAVFAFQGQRSAWLVRPRANVAFVDASTGALLARTDARALGVHQRISEMADPLHFGNFAGYWTKIPWFLFGLVLTFLCVSGCAIYAVRIADRGRESIAWRGGWRHAWRGMGPWRWPALAMLVVAFALLPWVLVPGAG